jgi:glucokinase
MPETPEARTQSYPRLDLVAGRPVIGFDIGGTETKIGLVAADGEAIDVRSEPTAIGSEQLLLDQLVAAVEDARERFPETAPAAIGVHVPGLVDDAHGVVIRAENLYLQNVPMREQLERRTGLPVAFGNDARGAGFAEFRMGAARGYHNALVVAIGTGIGAAVFVDGRSYDADGFGCELGHMRMIPPGAEFLTSESDVICACGGIGCLETYSSAGGIARAYERVTGRAVDGAKEVFDAARDGDVAAIAVRENAIDMLALAFAQIATVLAPQVIVVAGGLSHAGEEFFRPLRERIDAMLTFHRRPRILTARFGGQAGVIASALRADELLAR